jgi:hypothetical protein
VNCLSATSRYFSGAISCFVCSSEDADGRERSHVTIV